MKTATTTANQVASSLRFDARFFLDVSHAAQKRLNKSHWPFTTVAEVFGSENIRLPNRFERVPAATLDHGKPILVPYDCFRYVPYSNDILSRSQIRQFSKLEIERGWMLIVCSGRNLGPTTIVDRFLSRFVLTHDMVRIVSPLTDELFYFAAFTHTPMGQAIIRRDQHGSVIAHLNAEQVAAIRYPVVDRQLRTRCIDSFRKAFELRERARESLQSLSAEFIALTEFHGQWHSEADRSRRFTVNRNMIGDRFDAEPLSPLYQAYARRAESTEHTTIGGVAAVFKPPGRYTSRG